MALSTFRKTIYEQAEQTYRDFIRDGIHPGLALSLTARKHLTSVSAIRNNIDTVAIKRNEFAMNLLQGSE